MADSSPKDPSKILLSSVALCVHEEFNFTDSNVTIQSSDHICFKLHRKNLETHTGAFPGSEFSTNDEIVQLTEPASVLEIVFQFVYPRKQPRLEAMNFFTIIAVAEAVEKYEVFSAMYNCEKVLMEIIKFPTFAADILDHALRHNYPEMINESVRHLARRPALIVVRKLPSAYILSWLRYQKEWDNIFDKAIVEINKLVGTYNRCNKDSREVCYNCRSFLLARILEYKRIDTLVDLNIALNNACVPGTAPKYDICNSGSCGNGMCSHLVSVVAGIKEGVAAILPFTEFLKYRPDTNED